jgi:hypothetical protein
MPAAPLQDQYMPRQFEPLPDDCSAAGFNSATADEHARVPKPVQCRPGKPAPENIIRLFTDRSGELFTPRSAR